MTCTTTCRQPRGKQTHCGAEGCHQTFAGITGFDFHRHGPADERRCAHPAAIGMHLNAHGVWSMPGGNTYWPRPQVSDDAQTAEPASAIVGSGSDIPNASEALSGGAG